MGRKWSNKNLPGALHFVTGNIDKRRRIFTRAEACQSFIHVCAELRQEWPFKLVAYVLMPDHLHLIINPRDGKIRELMGKIKSLSARRIIAAIPDVSFIVDVTEAGEPVHQVFQESFKAFALWSDWLIWQKINYIHANPVRTGLVKSTSEYRWSSYKSFYGISDDPLGVDKDWWWPEDVKKLAVAAGEVDQEMVEAIRKKRT